MFGHKHCDSTSDLEAEVFVNVPLLGGHLEIQDDRANAS